MSAHSGMYKTQGMYKRMHHIGKEPSLGMILMVAVYSKYFTEYASKTVFTMVDSSFKREVKLVSGSIQNNIQCSIFSIKHV